MISVIPLWPTVRNAVASHMSAAGVSISQLAVDTGLSRSTLQGAILGNADTQWGTAAKILSALGLDLTWVSSIGAAGPSRKRRAKR